MSTCTCRPGRSEIGTFDPGCRRHDPAARVDAAELAAWEARYGGARQFYDSDEDPQPSRIICLLIDALVHERARSARFADKLATAARETTHHLVGLGRRIHRHETAIGALAELIDEPGIRHLQPPNWRARVEQIFEDLRCQEESPG